LSRMSMRSRKMSVIIKGALIPPPMRRRHGAAAGPD
jgi:hypothetical protein